MFEVKILPFALSQSESVMFDLTQERPKPGSLFVTALPAEER